MAIINPKSMWRSSGSSGDGSMKIGSSAVQTGPLKDLIGSARTLAADPESSRSGSRPLSPQGAVMRRSTTVLLTTLTSLLAACGGSKPDAAPAASAAAPAQSELTPFQQENGIGPVTQAI